MSVSREDEPNDARPVQRRHQADGGFLRRRLLHPGLRAAEGALAGRGQESYLLQAADQELAPRELLRLGAVCRAGGR